MRHGGIVDCGTGSSLLRTGTWPVVLAAAGVRDSFVRESLGRLYLAVARSVVGFITAAIRVLRITSQRPDLVPQRAILLLHGAQSRCSSFEILPDESISLLRTRQTHTHTACQSRLEHMSHVTRTAGVVSPRHLLLSSSPESLHAQPHRLDQ